MRTAFQSHFGTIITHISQCVKIVKIFYISLAVSAMDARSASTAVDGNYAVSLTNFSGAFYLLKRYAQFLTYQLT